MLDPRQFRVLVIRPTLKHLKMWTPAAENLLLGTAAHESRLTYLKQHGSGPALGVYQIEPATHEDVWENYLKYKGDIAGRVRALASQNWPGENNMHRELITNLAYATAIARLVYYRRPEPMPAANDIDGLARYWKQHYNTPLGAGRPAEFVAHYPS